MTHRILLVLLCVTFVSCKRHATPSNPSLTTPVDRGVASTSTIPGSTEARVDTLAARLPASTQVAWMTGDLAAARATVSAMEPILSIMTDGQDIRSELRDAHFDALDASMWSEMGIPEHSAMTFAYADGRLFWLIFVEDSAKFDTSFSARLSKSFDSTSVREEFEGYLVHTVSAASGEHISWLHDGKLAIVALGSDVTTDEAHEAQLGAIEALTHTLRDESCASTPAFAQWRQAIDPSDPMYAYANVEAIAQSEELMELVARDPDSAGSFEMIKANAKTLGIRVQRHSPKSFAVSAIFGGTPEANVEAMRMGDLTTPFPFGGLVNQDAMFGLRLSLNVEHTLKALEANMPPNDKRVLQAQLDAISASWGTNRDVTEMFTGHAALFVYEVNLGKLIAVGTAAKRLHEALSFGVGVELTDNDVANAIIAYFSSRPDVKVTPLTGMTAITLPDKDGALYVRPRSTSASGTHPPQLYYRSDMLEEQRMLAIIARDVTKVTLRASELGSPFAGTASHGGIYMDAKKWAPIFKLMVGQLPLTQALDRLDEVAITGEQTPAGPSLSLRFTLIDAP